MIDHFLIMRNMFMTAFKKFVSANNVPKNMKGAKGIGLFPLLGLFFSRMMRKQRNVKL